MEFNKDVKFNAKDETIFYVKVSRKQSKLVKKELDKIAEKYKSVEVTEH